jgi:hypothetical protein
MLGIALLGFRLACGGRCRLVVFKLAGAKEIEWRRNEAIRIGVSQK